MMTVDPIPGLIVTLLIAGLFLYSGLHKLRNQTAFRAVLSDYGVKKLMLIPAALLMTSAEIIIAVTVVMLMITNNKFGMVSGIILLGFYTLLVTYYHMTGRRIGCCCNFGADEGIISPWHLIRNLLLLTASSLYLLPQSGRLLTWLDYTTAIFAVAMIAIASVITEKLNANSQYGGKV